MSKKEVGEGSRIKKISAPNRKKMFAMRFTILAMDL